MEVSPHRSKEEQDVGNTPECSPAPQQKSSSLLYDLKPEVEPPPSESRRVSFADTFGLNLVSIKEFDTWGTSIPSTRMGDSKYQSEYCLSFFFPMPNSDAELIRKLGESKIELESVGLLPGTMTLKGVIRVLNLCFDKRVYVRTTLDDWSTHFDMLAEFMPDSSDGETDRFSFRLTLLPLYSREGAKVEFCLWYETTLGTFWANNGGSNYVFSYTKKEDVQVKEGQKKTRRSCLKGFGRDLSTEACSTRMPREVLDEHKHNGEVIVWKSQDMQHLEEDRSQCCSLRRQQRASHLDQIRNHFAHREMAPSSGGSELVWGEDATAALTTGNKDSTSLSGGTVDRQTSSQGLEPLCEPDSPSPWATGSVTESMISPVSNDVWSRATPEAGHGKREEEDVLPGLRQINFMVKERDFCEVLSHARCVDVIMSTAEGTGALGGSLNSQEIFFSQSGAVLAAPQKETISGVQEVSEKDANTQWHNQTDTESNRDEKPCARCVEVTNGQLPSAGAEPQSYCHPSAIQHPFTFGIFVAPLYQQAFHRMETAGWDFTGEDVEDLEDDDLSEEVADEDAVATKRQTSVHVPVSPADQSESWYEKFLEASAGHRTVDICVLNEKDPIEDKIQNISLQAQLFLGQEAESSLYDDSGDSNTEGSYSAPAGQVAKCFEGSDEDGLVLFQGFLNNSSENRTVLQGCDVFTSNLGRGLENATTEVVTNDEAIAGNCKKNDIDASQGEDVYGLNEDADVVKNEAFIDKECEDKDAVSDGQDKKHNIFGKIQKSLNGVKDRVLTHTTEPSENEEVLKSEEETFLSEAEKAFSEEVDGRSVVKECTGGDKVFIADKDNFLIEMKDTLSDEENMLIKKTNRDERDREINSDDIFRERLGQINEVKMLCGEKDKDITGQDGFLQEERTYLNMLNWNEADKKDTLQESTCHLETIFSVNVEYTHEAEIGMRKEDEYFSEGGEDNKSDVFTGMEECSLEGDWENYVNKEEREGEFYLTKEGDESHVQKHEDGGNGGLTVEAEYLKKDEQEGRRVVLEQQEGQQTIYVMQYEDEGNVGQNECVKEEKSVDKGEARGFHLEADGTLCKDEQSGVNLGEYVFEKKGSGTGACDEQGSGEMDVSANVEDVEDNTSVDSLSDEEMEQHLLGLKCLQKCLHATSRPHGDVLSPAIKTTLIRQTPLPSIRESPDEGCYADEDRRGSQCSVDLTLPRQARNITPVRLPSTGDVEKPSGIILFLRNNFSSFGDVSKAVIYAMLAALFLVTVYRYDFLTYFVLYLFSLFWLCCHEEKQ